MPPTNKTDPEPSSGSKRARPKVISAKKAAEARQARKPEIKGLLDWFAEAMQAIWEYEDADADDKALSNAPELEAWLYSSNCLWNSGDELLQRTAWFAYFRHQFGQTFQTHDQCKGMFEKMEEKGVLVKCKEPDPQADLPGGWKKFGEGEKKVATIYGSSYNLPGGLPFIRQDIAEFRQLYKGLRKRTQEAVKKYRTDRREELANQATIDPMQALNDSQHGIFTLDVPPQTVDDKKRPGKTFTHQGCRLLVKYFGNRLLVLDVVNEVGGGGMGVAENNVRKAMGRHPQISASSIFAGRVGAAGLLGHMLVRGFEDAIENLAGNAKIEAKAKAKKAKARKPMAKPRTKKARRPRPQKQQQPRSKLVREASSTCNSTSVS